MTLASWKSAYYPVPAGAVEVKDSTAHSLRKWEGLRPAVLKEHGLRVDAGCLRETGTTRYLGAGFLELGSRSCALCHHFFNHGPEVEDGRECSKCPLARSRGGVPCEGRTLGERVAPWVAFWRDQDPEPMIAALQNLVKEQE